MSEGDYMESLEEARMIRTQIQLTDAQARRIKRIAATRHVSMAEVIRTSVDAFLQESEQDDRASRKGQALSVIGRFSSGTKNLSREHDRHLAEAFE